MSKFRVGVKFCGNCNPTIDGPDLVEKLREKLPEMEFVRYYEEPRDLMLIVSSCTVDCATRPDWQGPTVVVAGHTVDYVQYKNDEMLEVIIRKLEEYRRQDI